MKNKEIKTDSLKEQEMNNWIAALPMEVQDRLAKKKQRKKRKERKSITQILRGE